MTVWNSKAKYIVLNEVNIVSQAIRRSSGRYHSRTHHQTNLSGDDFDDLIPHMKGFVDLKQVIAAIQNLSNLEPFRFVQPFLEVIRADDVNGPITSLALSSINKFLSYGLINASNMDKENKIKNEGKPGSNKQNSKTGIKRQQSITSKTEVESNTGTLESELDKSESTQTGAWRAIEAIADALKNARFIGTEPKEDEVVLMKILQVSRTLILTPIGQYLSNDSVCYIMQSCFRICFEMRLSELLRRSAEQSLIDMVQVLFTRLPELEDDDMNNVGYDKMGFGYNTVDEVSTISSMNGNDIQTDQLHYTTSRNASDIEQSTPLVEAAQNPLETANSDGSYEKISENETTNPQNSAEPNNSDSKTTILPQSPAQQLDFTNPQGVKFKSASVHTTKLEQHQPYGITAVRDLLVFLVSLLDINGEKEKRNTDVMVRIGLALIQVALEVSRDSIINQPTLLSLVQDEMSLYLYQILSSEKVNLVSQALNVNLLLFESLRTNLKFQLEAFLQRLLEISCMTDPKNFIPLEIREMALEQLNTVLAIPGFPIELYLNYDCDFYCSNLLEDIVSNLSKSSYLKYTHQMTQAQLQAQLQHSNTAQSLFLTQTTQSLCLETLLGVLDGIEQRCQPNNKKVEPSNGTISTTHDSNSEENPNVHPLRFTCSRPSVQELRQVKSKKMILCEATEKFNEKPKRGVKHMIENNLIPADDLTKVVQWLRENPDLDKNQIGDYISSRDANNNWQTEHPEKNLLYVYVKSFQGEWNDTRIDSCLRVFLESFRLPGEAPVISRIIEFFASFWISVNGECGVVDEDGAYTLAYAIIMLNVDQHNKNVAKNQTPMIVEQFIKNLRKCNGPDGECFPKDMLTEIYEAIRTDEIVLPAEQKGAIRDQYIWKVIMKRLATDEGCYLSIVDDLESDFTDENGEMVRITEKQQLTSQNSTSDSYEKELFCLVWEPMISSLSQTFQNRPVQDNQKTIAGFKKCAMLAARFNCGEVFSKIMIDLGRFSYLIPNSEKLSYITGKVTSVENEEEIEYAATEADMSKSIETIENLENMNQKELYRKLNAVEVCEHAVLRFANSEKSQHAAKTMFNIARKHGNNLSGNTWKLLLEAYLPLYRSQVFPENSCLASSEDFSVEEGSSPVIPDLRLRRQQSLNTESGWWPFGGGSTTAADGSKMLTAEQIGVLDGLKEEVVPELELDSIVMDSRFLRLESLLELTKAITNLGNYSGDSALFYLELFIQIILKNKDRAGALWQYVRQYFANILLKENDSGLLVERACTGLIRIAIRLGPCSPPVAKIGFQTLQLVLLIQPETVSKLQQPIANGIKELIRTQSANIHRRQDWFTILQLLMYASLGANFQPEMNKLAIVKLLGKREGQEEMELVSEEQLRICKNESNDQSTSQFSDQIDPTSLSLSIAAIEQLIRHNAVNVSPVNFPLLVDCLTNFNKVMRHGKVKVVDPRNGKIDKQTRRHSSEEQLKEEVTFDHLTISLKLVDLMASLHQNAAIIYRSTNARYAVELDDGETLEDRLWMECWEPLLIAISRACCDSRKQVS